MASANRKMNWDRWGAVASSVCAVHCLLTGAAFGLLSVVGLSVLGSEMAEWAFVTLTVGLGVTALVHGARRHHSLVPAYVFCFGMACLLVSKLALGPHDHGHPHLHPEDVARTVLNVVAGLSLVTFHVVNNRLQHRCGSLHCDHRHD